MITRREGTLSQETVEKIVKPHHSLIVQTYQGADGGLL